MADSIDGGSQITVRYEPKKESDQKLVRSTKFTFFALYPHEILSKSLARD